MRTHETAERSQFAETTESTSTPPWTNPLSYVAAVSPPYFACPVVLLRSLLGYFSASAHPQETGSAPAEKARALRDRTSTMLPISRARSASAAGRRVTAALCCYWTLLLLASRPAAVKGFTMTPRGGLSGTRYSHCAAMGADLTRTASCLFFMGGGGVEGDERAKGGLPGDQAKKGVLSPDTESELRLPAGYPFPHASRSNIRRRAMKFLR